MKYDVVIAGGGIGGSATALALTAAGMRVLLLERESTFKDRVRGEGLLPWGVNEARDLGIYDLLAHHCGRPVNYWTSHVWANRPPRNLVETTPRGSHCINFYHPDMQETMIGAAEEAGADVYRNAKVVGIESGAPVRVTFERDSRSETVDARLLVGADGRSSKIRSWGGFEKKRDPERMMIAGILLKGVKAPEDSVHVFRKSDQGIGALLFPHEHGKARTYFIYRKRNGSRRGLTGETAVPKLLKACIEAGFPEEWIEGAASAGPLAEFEGADYWTPHPHRNGVVLIGAAAAGNDPSWGNGLSITLRDVRTLRDCLLAQDDWAEAADAYAAKHDRDFGAIRRVTTWLTDLLYEVGSDADARREKVYALMASDRSRNPDYIALGPESPSDETARKRMFGEE